MTKVGVVLSGCGVFDGSEIYETVATLLALDRAGAEVIAAAPDVEFDVVDHYSGKATGEKRNVLVESARIMRGKIKPLAELREREIDALILPGGFGAAKNLSDFASKGAKAAANPEVARILREVHKAGKPIGAICIAPAVLATVFAGESVPPTLTIGNDAGTAAAIEAKGAKHVDCPVREFVVDTPNRIVTTPAYMLAERVSEAADGIEKLVKAVLDLAGH
ncbi:MAG: isoprenoid biosynthesis glyoxalase ElbB [Candidatus Krumholzibacteriia bacterium]|nr:isoprenoid biosynthesis glyoxalase ElbB [bacterium]MCB9517152.1 isoprenoid biosynthesis glyoxalase ElbB [Candidatus Latescibacterota bacterium]